MALRYSPRIVTDGLVFAWNGLDLNCWDGSSNTHRDLISGNTGTKTGASALSKSGNHVYFTGGDTRNCYISFPSSNITVPTGNQATWMWANYFIDAGNIDHPCFGKEAGTDWDGSNGFVFGTGWGTDGPRWGVAGTIHSVFADTGDSSGDYRTDVWQIYCVTYEKNSGTGLKTYLCDSNGTRLVDTNATSDVAIGSNSNALHIGATNNRGGNWNGGLDFVYMWNRALNAQEINQTLSSLKTKFGL